MTTVLDKETVKEALRELIREEPDAFKTLLEEVLTEEQVPGGNEQLSRKEKFDQLLKNNFERFDKTYRALA